MKIRNKRSSSSYYNDQVSKAIAFIPESRNEKRNSKPFTLSFKELANSNFVWLIITTFIVAFLTFSFMPSSPLSPNNLETIAVLLVAYHEVSCIGAIETALSFAKYPQRISFFIANAGTNKKSKSCLAGYDLNAGMRSEIIQKNIGSITEIFSSDYGVNAVKAELIENEIMAKHKTFDFVLEAHAHSLFNNDWDTEVITEWELLNDAKGVLTTYPSRASEISQRRFDHNKGKTMNIICSADFLSNGERIAMYYESPWEIKPPKVNENGIYLPVEVPFWSSYFSFGQFEYLVDVKYDPKLKTMTEEDGVEFLYSMRLRTSGYRMYAPVRDVVFHNYKHHRVEMKYKRERDQKQLRLDQERMSLLLKSDGDTENEYGAGNEMYLIEWYKLVGVNLEEGSAANLCEDIRHLRWHS